MHCTDMNIEVLNKVEVDRYGEYCMTLLLMYHRAMITVDRPITVICTDDPFRIDWIGVHRSTY